MRGVPPFNDVQDYVVVYNSLAVRRVATIMANKWTNTRKDLHKEESLHQFEFASLHLSMRLPSISLRIRRMIGFSSTYLFRSSKGAFSATVEHQYITPSRRRSRSIAVTFDASGHGTHAEHIALQEHNGDLDLHHIISKRLLTRQFTFLSVCHSGEVMHLADFPNVLATKWEAGDDTPIVTNYT